MLSIRGVPDELENSYTEYKILAKKIYNAVKGTALPERLPPETDVWHRAQDGSVIYLLEGYFKLIAKDKVIRLYSEGDFVDPAHNFEQHILKSDFAGDVVFFNRASLLAQLKEDEALFSKWIELAEFENKLNLALANYYLPKEVEAKFELKDFAPGEFITKEGDPPTAIFEMMSGSATVFSGGKEIGTISAEEIFGELSFLADTPRTATVVAKSRCFVRLVSKVDFFSLLETNPHLGLTISRTLAQRIIALNDRLVKI